MKPGTLFLKLAFALLVSGAMRPSLWAAPPNTGVQGRALIHVAGSAVEVEPGVWLGDGGFTVPAATSFVILSAHSRHVAGRFTTNVDGSFEVSLTPGLYVLIPETINMPFGCSLEAEAVEFKVKAKQYTQATIVYYQQEPCSVGTVQ